MWILGSTDGLDRSWVVEEGREGRKSSQTFDELERTFEADPFSLLSTGWRHQPFHPSTFHGHLQEDPRGKEEAARLREDARVLRAGEWTCPPCPRLALHQSPCERHADVTSSVYSSPTTKFSSWSERLDRERLPSELQLRFSSFTQSSLLPFSSSPTDCSCSFSTRIPQFVAFSDLPQLKGKMIACTQPRRVAATSVAKRVADEMDGEPLPLFRFDLSSSALMLTCPVPFFLF